jgi:hypothetical protein
VVRSVPDNALDISKSGQAGKGALSEWLERYGPPFEEMDKNGSNDGMCARENTPL